MRENRTDDKLGASTRAQNFGAAKWMILQLGILLVVEIMQQRHDAPHFFVFAEGAGVPANRGFHRKRMLPQALAFGVLGEDVPRVVACQFKHRCSMAGLKASTTY